MFIINEHGIITNTAPKARPLNLNLYQPFLQKWMPKATIRTLAKPLARFDGVITWKAPERTVRYLVEEKRHLRHQDVGVVVAQLNRGRADLPPDHLATGSYSLRRMSVRNKQRFWNVPTSTTSISLATLICKPPAC